MMFNYSKFKTSNAQQTPEIKPESNVVEKRGSKSRCDEFCEELEHMIPKLRKTCPEAVKIAEEGIRDLRSMYINNR